MNINDEGGDPMTREQAADLIVARAKVRQEWEKLAKAVGVEWGGGE
jgi:hypothetical protein